MLVVGNILGRKTGTIKELTVDTVAGGGTGSKVVELGYRPDFIILSKPTLALVYNSENGVQIYASKGAPTEANDSLFTIGDNGFSFTMPSFWDSFQELNLIAGQF